MSDAQYTHVVKVQLQNRPQWFYLTEDGVSLNKNKASVYPKADAEIEAANLCKNNISLVQEAFAVPVSAPNMKTLNRR